MTLPPHSPRMNPSETVWRWVGLMSDGKTNTKVLRTSGNSKTVGRSFQVTTSLSRLRESKNVQRKGAFIHHKNGQNNERKCCLWVESWVELFVFITITKRSRWFKYVQQKDHCSVNSIKIDEKTWWVKERKKKLHFLQKIQWKRITEKWQAKQPISQRIGLLANNKASFTTYNEKKNVEANRVGTLSKYNMKSHK